MAFSDRKCDLCDQPASIFGSGWAYCHDDYDAVNVWQRAVDVADSLALGGPFPQTCPRRGQQLGPWKMDAVDEDEWRLCEPLGGAGIRLFICSFCGSLHPDTFMEKIREGWVVGPTDKSYKAYLGQPFTADEIAARKTGWMAGQVAAAMRASGATDAELDTYWDKEMAPTCTDHDVAKFSYQHLSGDQRGEFVDMLNVANGHLEGVPEGTPAMRIGYPGYFYAPPFFLATRTG